MAADSEGTWQIGTDDAATMAATEFGQWSPTHSDPDADLWSLADSKRVPVSDRALKRGVLQLAEIASGERTCLALLVTGDITAGGNVGCDAVVMTEAATVPGGAPDAGTGVLWVKNDTPNTLWFTDDAGTDVQVAGAGSADDLADTLAAGNTTGGTGIEVTNGDSITGQDGGSLAFATTTGIVQLSQCAIATSTTTPVVTGGDFGTGTGAGTAATMHGGDGGSTGGAGAAATFRGGDAQAGDTAGGAATLRSGNSTGTVDAPNVELSSGSVGTGNLGVVKITNTCLEIAEAATVPGPTIGAGVGRIWVRSDAPSRPVFTDDAGTDHDYALVGQYTAFQNFTTLAAETVPEALASTNLQAGGLGFPTAVGQIVAADWVNYTGANVGAAPSINGYAFSTIAGEGATIGINVVTVDLDTTLSTAGDTWLFLLRTSTAGDVIFARVDIVP